MDKEYIIGIVQGILNKEFTSSSRRHINIYPDRINFCCVKCGDGKSETKKRGNIRFSDLRFACFNCGHKCSFDRLCKDYSIALDPSKKMEMIEYLNSIITYKDVESDIIDTQFDKLIDIKDLEIAFNSDDINITDFKPVQKDSHVYNYLIGRGIYDNLHTNIYQAKYWMGSERYEHVLMILNKRGNKVLGAQIRNLKSGKKRLFKIYNFETLYKWVTKQEEITDIDINQLITYNKLSYYFNILNIDFCSKITLFEGYLDSLFFPNSIGMVGTNTDLRFIESNNLELQYFFDNDIAGYKKSEEKIKGGFNVFLWKKLFDHIVRTKNSNDPYKLYERISTVKDLNSLSELVKNPFKTLDLDKFFSRDIYDKMYLSKQPKKLFIKKSF